MTFLSVRRTVCRLLGVLGGARTCRTTPSPTLLGDTGIFHAIPMAFVLALTINGTLHAQVVTLKGSGTVMDRRLASARGVTPVSDRRPLIVFDAGLRSDALSYFALAEFLSSHGYICVSAPSLPFAADKPLTLDEAGIRWKADQIGRVIRLARQHSSVDPSRIGLAAWSVGGVTTAIVAKSSGARALISLDGGLGYDYGPPLARRVLGIGSILEVPTLHVTGTAANPFPGPKTFAAFDSATVSHVYRAEIAAINHSHFVAHAGVVRYSSDTASDAAQFWRANEAVARLVLLFADTFIAEGAPTAEFAARAGQLSPDVRRIVR